jgi:hypothetical protein
MWRMVQLLRQLQHAYRFPNTEYGARSIGIGLLLSHDLFRGLLTRCGRWTEPDLQVPWYDSTYDHLNKIARTMRQLQRRSPCLLWMDYITKGILCDIHQQEQKRGRYRCQFCQVRRHHGCKRCQSGDTALEGYRYYVLLQCISCMQEVIFPELTRTPALSHPPRLRHRY